MVSYQVSFDSQYKKHDTIPYSDDSSSLNDPQSWDRKSLYRSTVLGSKVFIQIHSLGTKGIAALINTNNSTSHSNGFWNRRCPDPQSWIKGIYLYRSTVLGSNVYMYTDQVHFKANQHRLSAQHTTHHIRLREQSCYDQTHSPWNQQHRSTQQDAEASTHWRRTHHQRSTSIHLTPTSWGLAEVEQSGIYVDRGTCQFDRCYPSKSTHGCETTVHPPTYKNTNNLSVTSNKSALLSITLLDKSWRISWAGAIGHFCWPRNMSVWPLLSVKVNARLWNHGRWINTQDTNAHMECPSQMDTPLLATLPQHKLANQSKPPNPEAFTNLRISQVEKCEPLDPQSWDQSHSCMDQYQQQHQPQHQVLKLKMYRSTVLGSKVYMYTDPQSWNQRQVYIDKQSWDQRHMYKQTVIRIKV